MDAEHRHRVAIADCGTNTFTLHIARITAEGWATVFQQRRLVRLGADSFRTGRLAPDRMRRGLDVLSSFREAALNLGVTHLRAVGCSALRDAANAPDFLRRAADLGWAIDVIDGDQEAHWIHLGVADTVPLDSLGDRVALTLDIGGGSVECVVWDREQVFGRYSLDLGVARLTDWIKPADPLRASDVASLKKIVDAALDPVMLDLGDRQPTVLVGTSGAFNALAAVEDADAAWHDPRIADALPLPTLKSRCQALSKLDKAALRDTPGIHPDRVPYMALACVLIDHVLDRFPIIEEVRRSRHTVAEGILVEATRGISKGLSSEWRAVDGGGEED